MKNEPPHFARPNKPHAVEPAKCIYCGQPIYLHENPDGRKVWRHVSDK